MKRISLILPLLSIIAISTIGSAEPSGPDALWSRAYGDSTEQRGRSAVVTDDGGFVLAGYSGVFPEYDVILIRTDSHGDTVWTKLYDWAQVDCANEIRGLHGGGYIVVGLTGTMEPESLDVSYDVLLLKIDEGGSVLWKRTYDRSDWDVGSSVQPTSDGGYMIAANAGQFDAFDIWLIRTDADGDTLWTKTYGETNWDQAWCIQGVSAGGYIIVGNVSRPGEFYETYDVYLMRTDSLGDTLWTKTHGGASSDIGLCVQEASDGGYIVTGWTDSFGAGNQDVYLVKTDAEGDSVWMRTYGGSTHDYGRFVCQTTDGAFIVAGYTYSFGAGGMDIYLIKTGTLGETIWTRTYGGPETEQAYWIDETSDGGYVVVGEIVRPPAWILDLDVYLVRTEPDTSYTQPHTGFITMPNPSSETVVVSYSLATTQTVNVTICDVLGREVATLVDGTRGPGTHVATWNARNARQQRVASGIYFVRLQAGDQTATRKVVLVR